MKTVFQLSALALGSVVLPLFATAAPPPRVVQLQCAPAPYVFTCSIPRTADPAFGTHCWYRSGSEGYLMRSDRRFTFFNDIVRLKVRDGRRVTAEYTELASGKVGHCSH